MNALRSLAKLNVNIWQNPVRADRWACICLLALSGWMCCTDAQAVDVEESFRAIILPNTGQYLPATNY
jgi:hypothetical protein